MHFFPSPYVIKLDAVDSTNNYAANLLKQTKIPEFTLIVTKRQEKGKGQRGAHWYSEAEKNFTGTFVLYPSTELSGVFELQKMVAVLTQKLISSYCPEKQIKIKWPNDILMNGQKIAGILMESQVHGEKFEYILAGIGININQQKWPSTIQNVTSLSSETGKVVNMDTLYTRFQKMFRDEFYQLKDHVDELYYDSLYGYQQWMYYIDRQTSERFTGSIQAVTQEGFLILEDQLGARRQYDIKEIEFTHEFPEAGSPYS